MLLLSHEQMLSLSDWQPISPGYGRESATPLTERINPLVAALRKRHWLGVELCCVGGSENFAHIFVFDANRYPVWTEDDLRRTRTHEGTSAYLSLLGPYAAIGQSTEYMSYDKKPVGNVLGVGGAAYLSLERVMDVPDRDDTVTQALFNEARNFGYTPLHKGNLATLLPDGMEPMDSSGLGPPPYTYFDLLFNRTD